jgi:hypothetical protein
MSAAVHSIVIARYRLPVCGVSLEEDLRAVNADLPQLSRTQLWAEEARVTATLAYVTAEYASGCYRLPVVYDGPWRIDGREWLLRRLRAVHAEAQRRKGRNDA